MIASYYFTLLKDLVSTYKPKEQLAIIQEFIALRGRDNDPDELQDLLDFYKQRVLIKQAQGHMSDVSKAETRAKKEGKQNKLRKNKEYPHPKFFLNYTAHKSCAVCQQVIESDYAFRHKIDGKYYDYHPIPSCFPENLKIIMQEDPKYLAKMQKSDYIKNEIIIDPVLGDD